MYQTGKNDINSEVAQVFEKYPKHVRVKVMALRKLILSVAKSNDILIEETLKWGEPSYLCKKGSTIRIDWKRAKPNQYAMYLNCKTKLVETFKEIYNDELIFEGNRAIIFSLEEKVPIEIIKHCIVMALSYHTIKHLPLLGL